MSGSVSSVTSPKCNIPHWNLRLRFSHLCQDPDLRIETVLQNIAKLQRSWFTYTFFRGQWGKVVQGCPMLTQKSHLYSFSTLIIMWLFSVPTGTHWPYPSKTSTGHKVMSTTWLRILLSILNHAVPPRGKITI